MVWEGPSAARYDSALRMELEDVDERVEWKCRRIAVASEVEKWEKKERRELHALLLGRVGSHFVGCIIHYATGHIAEIGVWKDDLIAVLLREGWGGRQEIVEFDRALPDNCVFMARGLYRLGFEDEGVLSQLPSLTAHEKMELRLSMPRQFWPKTWLEEYMVTCERLC